MRHCQALFIFLLFHLNFLSSKRFEPSFYKNQKITLTGNKLSTKHNLTSVVIFVIIMPLATTTTTTTRRSALDVAVIVVGNRMDDPSSNPG